MKHTVRAFSIGLITTGLILLGVFYFIEDSQEQAEEVPTEELISRIEEDGFRVITEEEYISFSLASDTNQSESEEAEDEELEENEETNDEEDVEEDPEESEEAEEEDTEENDESEEEEEEETPSTVSITIESGMASSAISSLLEDEGLVDDAEEFNNYLLENDYSFYVQLGEHELETGMTYYELAEALTN